jgi:HPt (histidine-containing phosphotransfer) domain-containing protein
MNHRQLLAESAHPDDGVAARIRRAEAAIAGLKANFKSWVKADVDSINVHFDAARLAGDDTARAGEFEALRRIAHNIKGQGGTFGCHAMSAAACELDTLLKRQNGAEVVDRVAALVANLNAAFAAELT